MLRGSHVIRTLLQETSLEGIREEDGIQSLLASSTGWQKKVGQEFGKKESWGKNHGDSIKRSVDLGSYRLRRWPLRTGDEKKALVCAG